MLDIARFVDRRTIIVGDINSGKTRYTLDILAAFLKAGLDDIAVLDCAPAKVEGVGGKMSSIDDSDILYATTDVAAPRLTGRTEDEVYALARRNAAAIETLFDDYRRNCREHLFINDVTLYLHAGSVERLMGVLTMPSSVIMNAYYGSTFDDSPLTRREREGVEHLLGWSDNVIRL